MPAHQSEFEFPIGQRISLPGHFPEPVVLEAVRPVGSSYECRVRLPDGTPDETILSAEEARELLGSQITAAKTVEPVDAEKLRLLVESARIRLAYAHDRHFAVSLSRSGASICMYGWTFQTVSRCSASTRCRRISGISAGYSEQTRMSYPLLGAPARTGPDPPGMPCVV